MPLVYATRLIHVDLLPVRIDGQTGAGAEAALEYSVAKDAAVG